MNDRFALFLMDYPNRTRLKVIGHAKLIEPATELALEAEVREPRERSRIERILRLNVVGFDWNRNQHITLRYSRKEIEEHFPARVGVGS